MTMEIFDPNQDKEEKDILALDNRGKTIGLLQLVQQLKKEKEKRRLQILSYRVWRNYFRQCKKDTFFFLRDPLNIEKKYSEIVLLTKYFTKGEWPELYTVIKEIYELLTETEKVRNQIKLSHFLSTNKEPS